MVSAPIPAGTRLIRAITGRYRTEGAGGWYNPGTGVWNVGAIVATNWQKSLSLVLETTGSGPVTVTARLTRVDQQQATTGDDIASDTAIAPIPAAPPNDDIAAAIDISGPEGTVTGLTINATSEGFEPYGIATSYGRRRRGQAPTARRSGTADRAGDRGGVFPGHWHRRLAGHRHL